MSSKEVKVKTPKGWKLYRVKQNGSKFTCYDKNGWSEKQIGESRSLEDAITLIKVDAQQFGGVSEVKM
ncbi:MAG: hypothetical protein MRZ79_03725 [Bacteroidia bacterium]|nr:hypothetical protein [Bacteroidia bacterium]